MSISRRRAPRALRRVGILAAATVLLTAGCTASGGGDAPAEEGGSNAEVTPVKIALSNNFNGNIWRKQMEASFETTAAENPDYFSDAKIVVSDGSAPQQAQQIQSLVLEGYEAILIEPGSPTGLNGAIEEACAAGVTVV
ncbi:MAG: substrate-binding domain-containing protein, partial [Leucobacter sp.]